MQSSKLPINLVPLLPCMYLLKSLLILPLAVAMMMILFSKSTLNFVRVSSVISRVPFNFMLSMLMLLLEL
ncbi:ATP-dependent dethiobiotin synthetase BioD [Bienertia sinuspersici]